MENIVKNQLLLGPLSAFPLKSYVNEGNESYFSSLSILSCCKVRTDKASKKSTVHLLLYKLIADIL